MWHYYECFMIGEKMKKLHGAKEDNNFSIGLGFF
jgi:hypothetical protein